MNAYALAAEDGTITLRVIGPTGMWDYELANAADLADTLKRAMAFQTEYQVQNTVLIKSQPEGVRIEGWDI